MERWIVWAILSMIFAGCTSVVAKQGLAGIFGELGLTLRTGFVCVCVCVLGFALAFVPSAELSLVTWKNLAWLGLSGVTTAALWIFDYKALKVGDFSTVALIDKGSFVVAVSLAVLLLAEKLPPRLLLGSGLIVAGLLVVSRK